MAQTFDTSRVGGGTYELEQDANGNYKLKSVGFAQVNKLNLPDLATSDTTSVADTTKKATEDTIKAQTTEVFKPTNMYQGGGEDARTFQDYERIVPKEAKVNEATVRSAGETIKSDMPQGSPNQLSKDKARAEANVELGLEPQNQYRSESAKFKERFDPTKIQAAAVKPNIIERAKTGITSAVDSVKNNKAIQMASNVLGFVTNPIIGGFKMVAGALNDPRQQALNKSNKDALSSLGYKTRGELGGSTDPGRIAGNPATNVFAGMNAQSAFGDPMRGARNRVSNIQKTIDRAKAKGDTAKAERFEARKEEFNRQIEEVQGKKNKADLATGGVAPGASGGGGGSGGCFLKGTLITMLDGTTKTVEQVDLGDKVAVGGKVFAVGRFLNTELYDYKGIKVSGSHMVNEDGVWVRVRDTKHGKSLGDDLNTVYVFGSENRRILIDNILFTDYFEVSEQDQLINNEKDFFNNWKSYENTIDEHNVNTLNAS